MVPKSVKPAGQVVGAWVTHCAPLKEYPLGQIALEVLMHLAPFHLAPFHSAPVGHWIFCLPIQLLPETVYPAGHVPGSVETQTVPFQIDPSTQMP